MKNNFNLRSSSQMELFPLKEVVVNEIPMGVLNDGTPYLTLYGLAKICGLDPTPLRVFTSNWGEARTKPRGQFVDNALKSRGYDLDNLYTKVVNKLGQETHAYPDYVCMAILEYYAFEAAAPFDATTARENFRALASYTLRRMIFEQVGFDPSETINKSWDVYKERILLNSDIPIGYFSLFREMADILVQLISNEFKLDPYSIPDISVGKHWGTYWEKNKLSNIHGERIKYPHNYPEGFPQKNAGTVEAWIYPNLALGEFRNWLDTTYVSQHLQPYLQRKVNSGALPSGKAEQILLASKKHELPN